MKIWFLGTRFDKSYSDDVMDYDNWTIKTTMDSFFLVRKL